MGLSGWVRLWVLASVVWWAAGAWWLMENRRPSLAMLVVLDEQGAPVISEPARARQAAAKRELGAVLAEPSPDPLATTDPAMRQLREAVVRGQKERTAKARAAATIADVDYDRTWELDWSEWTRLVWLVALAPLPGAALFLIGRLAVGWIRAGFNQQTNGRSRRG